MLCFLFLIAACGSGLAVCLFFFRYRAHKSPNAGWFRLLCGNLLVFLFLLSTAVCGGEIYYRWFYDTTDSFGLVLTTERWIKRHYRTNAIGFRDSVEYRPEIPAGKRRITFVGDSFTAGYGVADVEERFANRIRAQRPGWEVHVLAQNGLDTGGQLKMLRSSRGAGYQFDLVVLVYCLNDLNDLAEESGEGQRLADWDPGFLVERSYLFNTLYYRLQAAQDPVFADHHNKLSARYDGSLWDRQRQRLEKLHDEVRFREGRLLVVTFPFLHSLGEEYEYRTAHRRLGDFWIGLNVPHLDLLDLFRAHAGEDLVVNRFDAHPNERAHALAAAAIDRFLDEHLRSTETGQRETPGPQQE